MEDITVDLISAEKGKHAWTEKRTQTKKNALETLDPKVLQAKAAFEEVRTAWDAMRYYPIPEVTVPMAELIKTKAAAIGDMIDTNLQACKTLMALSATADALADLTVAARNHIRTRTGGVSTGGAVTVSGTVFSFTAGVGSFGALVFVGGTAAAILFSGGILVIPISFAGGYGLYRYYYPKPLAPRTTEAARTTIRTAQETVETAAHATSETIWAADTAWCRDAIRDADEFVTTITGAEMGEEE
ncbi:MAG: hypothetical protein A3F67_03240 [Verrucomicrobia bacterium RIFCSPHIGHO2_12_FULL_41_10]|nr:MAG: hypothetical protein A3F67_03240 [Verrucomicrobia bacterium RIFCSPHIGHO2_12_FULL_41_10]